MTGKQAPALEQGAGRGKLLFIDAFSGVAGDMLLSALFHLGIPKDAVLPTLAALPLETFEVKVTPCSRSGISALQLRVVAEQTSPQRNYREIRNLIEASNIPIGARKHALDAFHRLAQAEAAVHQMDVDDVHFHEVGALDSVVDIVGCCLALDHLDAEVVVSPLPLGTGFVRAQHGPLPVPTPATLLCLKGMPTEPVDSGATATGELVTPTGACLVAAHARRFARWPAVAPERVGYGAGSREVADRPNLLRLVLGTEAQHSGADVEGTREASSSPLLQIETNIDDMSGEIAGHLIDRLLAAGALDSWITQTLGKKGRPAWVVSALVGEEYRASVLHALLEHSTTLGARVVPLQRLARPRRSITVSTRFGEIEVKVAAGDGISETVSPEFESCKRAARDHQVPIKSVIQAAIAAASASRN